MSDSKRRQVTARFTASQAHTMWVLLDSTMCAQEDRREIQKWKRLRNKFKLPKPIVSIVEKEA